MLYQGIAETKDGIKILMASKDKALESVAKHLGMGVEKEEKKDDQQLVDALKELANKLPD